MSNDMNWELCLDDVPQGKRFATLNDGKAHCEKFGYHKRRGTYLEHVTDDLWYGWNGKQWVVAST